MIYIYIYTYTILCISVFFSLVGPSSWTRPRGPEAKSASASQRPASKSVVQPRGPEFVDPTSWTRGQESSFVADNQHPKSVVGPRGLELVDPTSWT